MDLEEARQLVYGMTYTEWKEHFQTEATLSKRPSTPKRPPSTASSSLLHRAQSLGSNAPRYSLKQRGRR